MLLDPRHSQITHSLSATFGEEGIIDEDEFTVDVSKAVRSIKDNSQWHPTVAIFQAIQALVNDQVIPMSICFDGIG